MKNYFKAVTVTDVLLQQRSLQAKMVFWEETKNELVAEWQASD
jgi:hypothetical protein